jgi:hypothetical protein
VKIFEEKVGEQLKPLTIQNGGPIIMIQVENDLRTLAAQFLGILHSTLCHVTKQGSVGIVASALRHLQDHRALQVGRGLDDSLELLHVVKVEGGNSIAAIDGSFEHLTGVHEA